jgi:hypothetical protein
MAYFGSLYWHAHYWRANLWNGASAAFPVLALTDQLIACYDLDELTGTRVDHVTGDVVGGQLFPGGGVSSVIGKVGHAARFSTGYLHGPHVLEGQFLYQQQFTIAFWCRPTSVPGATSALITNAITTAAGQYDYVILALATTAQLEVSFQGGDGGVVFSATNLTIGAWNLIVIWRDAATLSVQLNNGAIATAAFTPTITSSLDRLYLGATSGFSQTGEDFFAGDLDSLMVWDRVLLPAERGHVWNNGNGLGCDLAPPTVPLLLGCAAQALPPALALIDWCCTERIPRETAQARLQDILLRRLPPSLYQRAPDDATLQGVLMAALAAEMTRWLDSLTVLRQVTLMQTAEALDLDTLAQDYGCWRYNGAPDPCLRQALLQLLFGTQGTLAAVRSLAGLLSAHGSLTLPTGRYGQHVFLIDTHPVTAAYTYWQLSGYDGLAKYVFIQNNEVVVTDIAPPGINVTPGTDPLFWLTLLDETSALWYVCLDEGGALVLDTVPPTVGAGTDQTPVLLDGQGTTWTITVESVIPSLVPTEAGTLSMFVVPSTIPPLEYLVLVDSAAVPWILHITGTLPVFSATVPAGVVARTPSFGGPYAALQLPGSARAVPWYLTPSVGGGVVISQTLPDGPVLTGPTALGNGTGIRRHMGVNSSGVLVTTETPQMFTDGAPTVVAMNDRHGHAWFLGIEAETVSLTLSSFQPPRTVLITPLGEVGWVRLGSTHYLFPETDGSLVVSGAPPPSSVGGVDALPLTLTSAGDARWALTISTSPDDGTLVLDVAPAPPFVTPRDADHLVDLATALTHVTSASNLVSLVVT